MKEFGNIPKPPTEMKDVLANVDQHLSTELKLGASVKDILESDEPLVKHLMKGFKVETKLHVISNFKNAIFEVLKSDEQQAIAMMLMMFAPIAMLQLNAKIDIQFDDFSEIEDHPMAAPAMATFEQLFEGLAEATPQDAKKRKFNVDSIKEDDFMEK